jgi:hypothetical protein
VIALLLAAALVTHTTELPHPNPDRKHKAYRDQVVAGLAAAAPGYKLLERKDGEPSSAWTIDVVFERTIDGAAQVVAMRFWLHHDRTLIMTITMPAAEWPGAKREVMTKLRAFRYPPPRP